jgi:hypothetical protein
MAPRNKPNGARVAYRVDLSLTTDRIERAAADQLADLVQRGVSRKRAEAAARLTIKSLRRISRTADHSD